MTDRGTDSLVVADAAYSPRAQRGTDCRSRVVVSVIVPVCERPGSLSGLYREYGRVIQDMGAYEFIFITTPRYRHLMRELEELRAEGEPIRVMEVGHAVEEGTLLRAAAERARGNVLVTLPAYPRVRSEALPDMFRELEDGAELVGARRHPRSDGWVNRLQTRVFHWLLETFSGVELRDVACGVRVMRKEVLEETTLYGGFFRFLPVLAAREGFRIREVDAPQHPDDAERRIYSPGIYTRRLVDLLGLFFLTRFTLKPLRFFGLLGSLSVGTGGIILLVAFIQRLGGQSLANRPILVLGVLLVSLGIQALALGLIGEIIVHFNAPNHRGYRVVNSDEEK